jgi:phage FluMu gp28-like protein
VATQWIPWDLFEANCDPSIVVQEEPDGNGLFAGWDVARNRDLSVVWFSKLVGDINWTRAILVMANVPTPDQTARVARIMPHVHRLCIDRTGMGLQIFEAMDRLFPGKVEGISFSTATKEDDGHDGEAAHGRAALPASERPSRLAEFPLCPKVNHLPGPDSIRCRT